MGEMEIIECLECGTPISVEPVKETQKITCPECLIAMNVSKKDSEIKVEYAKGYGGIDGHPVKDEGYQDMSFGRYD